MLQYLIAPCITADSFREKLYDVASTEFHLPFLPLPNPRELQKYTSNITLGWQGENSLLVVSDSEYFYINETTMKAYSFSKR